MTTDPADPPGWGVDQGGQPGWGVDPPGWGVDPPGPPGWGPGPAGPPGWGPGPGAPGWGPSGAPPPGWSPPGAAPPGWTPPGGPGYPWTTGAPPPRPDRGGRYLVLAGLIGAVVAAGTVVAVTGPPFPRQCVAGAFEYVKTGFPVDTEWRVRLLACLSEADEGEPLVARVRLAATVQGLLGREPTFHRDSTFVAVDVVPASGPPTRRRCAVDDLWRRTPLDVSRDDGGGEVEVGCDTTLPADARGPVRVTVTFAGDVRDDGDPPIETAPIEVERAGDLVFCMVRGAPTECVRDGFWN